MVFQLDRYMHILCDITRLRLLGSGCTMATQESVCVWYEFVISSVALGDQVCIKGFL